MYFRLMGKLNARRQNLTEQDEKGFTLIELLVVVIIIGILAAIAIPVYLGVQNNAKDSSVQNDVSNLKTAIVSIQTNTGTLPASFTAVSSSATSFPTPSGGTATTYADGGATVGSNTSNLQYINKTTGFCIIGTSVTNKLFYATDSKGVSTTPCS